MRALALVKILAGTEAPYIASRLDGMLTFVKNSRPVETKRYGANPGSFVVEPFFGLKTYGFVSTKRPYCRKTSSEIAIFIKNVQPFHYFWLKICSRRQVGLFNFIFFMLFALDFVVVTF